MSDHDDELDHLPTIGEVYRLVKRIDRSLNGNGQPGLVKVVERHDAWLKVLGSGLLLIGGAVAKSFFP